MCEYRPIPIGDAVAPSARRVLDMTRKIQLRIRALDATDRIEPRGHLLADGTA
jgi:hypothetical protein